MRKKYRKPFYKRFASRCAARIARWRAGARGFWYRVDKDLVIFASVLGLVVTVFGFMTYSVFTVRDDRVNLTCLALNVYFEARGEPVAGQYAVAEVTMNRVASGRYPDTVCGVVHQKNWDVLRHRYVSAFSWTELSPSPKPEGEEWERAQKIAEEVYYRQRTPALHNALLYHATYMTPSWARGRTPVARIGNHVFYR
ncbi:MAG: cell wall hydrolase [Sulfuricaulis sp.]